MCSLSFDILQLVEMNFKEIDAGFGVGRGGCLRCDRVDYRLENVRSCCEGSFCVALSGHRYYQILVSFRQSLRCFLECPSRCVYACPLWPSPRLMTSMPCSHLPCMASCHWSKKLLVRFDHVPIELFSTWLSARCSCQQQSRRKDSKQQNNVGSSQQLTPFLRSLPSSVSISTVGSGAPVPAICWIDPRVALQNKNDNV